jgi:hypothetical protein
MVGEIAWPAAQLAGTRTWPEEELGRKKHLTRRARIDAAAKVHFLSPRASRVQFDGRHDQTSVDGDDGALRLPLAWSVHAVCRSRVRRLADLGRRHAQRRSTSAGRTGLRRVHGAPITPGRSAQCGAEHRRGARRHRCRCADWRSSWHDRGCSSGRLHSRHDRRRSAAGRQLRAATAGCGHRPRAAAAGTAASSLRPPGRSKRDPGWVVLDGAVAESKATKQSTHVYERIRIASALRLTALGFSQ